MPSTGKTMTPQVMFHNAASNIICQVLFARRYEYNDELIKLFVGIFTEVSKITNGPWATVSKACCDSAMTSKKSIYSHINRSTRIQLYPGERFWKKSNYAWVKLLKWLEFVLLAVIM